MIHTVASHVGSAIGIVASNAAKVVGGSDNAKTHKGEATPLACLVRAIRCPAFGEQEHEQEKEACRP